MKKTFLLGLMALSFAYTTNMGCIKSSSNTPGNNIVLPNVGNFSVSASNFVQGAASIISIASSTLGSGNFTVNYSITGANNLVNQIATLVMNGSTGTFSTPVLNGVSSTSANTVIINSITNASGGSATPTGGNTATFSDSTGLMTATITGASSGPTTFRSIQVTALAAGPSLQIDGVMWSPLTDIVLHLNNYNALPSVTPFDMSASTHGGASYQVNGNGILINDLGQTGTITISTVTPLFTGSFHYTNQDGSVVDGTFSCKTP